VAIELGLYIYIHMLIYIYTYTYILKYNIYIFILSHVTQPQLGISRQLSWAYWRNCCNKPNCGRVTWLLPYAANQPDYSWRIFENTPVIRLFRKWAQVFVAHLRKRAQCSAEYTYMDVHVCGCECVCVCVCVRICVCVCVCVCVCICMFVLSRKPSF